MAKSAAVIGGMMVPVLKGEGGELRGGERADHQDDEYPFPRRDYARRHLEVSIPKIKEGPDGPPFGVPKMLWD